eukprot:352917-Chlamydomonas_euryale.AAC.6
MGWVATVAVRVSECVSMQAWMRTVQVWLRTCARMHARHARGLARSRYLCSHRPEVHQTEIQVAVLGRCGPFWDKVGRFGMEWLYRVGAGRLEMKWAVLGWSRSSSDGVGRLRLSGPRSV